MAAELPPLVQALLSPAAYPYPVDSVALVQTHISYVFLAGDYAYKVKKPVDFGFLNFTTLARRRYYCHQEVRLNRRLCPELYLGVVAVTLGPQGYRVGGRGTTVEHAVWMRRLPQERMLDQLLAQSLVGAETVAEIAQRLAAFHRRAATGPRIQGYGRPAVIARNWQENFLQTEPYIGVTIEAHEHRELRAYVEEFLRARRPLLLARMQGGHIRDCHGDVRAENVCLSDGLYIFDCIEFNRRFRYCDIASDVAFLAMDLDFYGRRDLADLLVSRYAEAAADPELHLLVDFYKGYRAYVRGKVEGFRLDQPEIGPEERAQARALARRHFDLALAYARQGPRPWLVAMCGLVGTGKSSLAQALAQKPGLPSALGLTVLTSDVVRKELAGLPPQVRRQEPFGVGIYSAAFTRRTYGALLERARGLLGLGRSVVIDAAFPRRHQRRQARRLAQRMGARFLCLECRAPAPEVRRRLAERQQRGEGPSDADWRVYREQRRRFQPVTELPPSEHLALDLGGPLAPALRAVQERLGGP